MSAFKGTPGPWEVVPGDEWTTDIGTPEGEYEDGRKRHWNVASVNRLRDGWEANRLLIAAAPELLEALEEMVRMYGHRGGVDPYSDALLPVAHQPEEVSSAMAAIAKATGGDA